MKTCVVLVVTFLFLSFSKAWSCTTFVIQNETDLVFGRNLDWVSDNGLIAINQRGVLKRALVFAPDQPAVWTSKYGSVTFNQFGKEFPFGGINEEGLVVEIMLVSGKYPSADHRKAVNELQWVQYQLDNCKTIDEVIRSNDSIRISKINQNLHFLICDSTGQVAVIEFNNGKQEVYRGDDLKYPVLENDTYKNSLVNRENNKSCRFNTAVNLVELYDEKNQKNAIQYSFDILDQVKLDGSWSIVYDIKNMSVHFNTASDRKEKFFNLNRFDFSCKQRSKVYDLKEDFKGDISDRFVVFSNILNKQKFDDGLKKNGLYLPSAIYDLFLDYPDACSCKDN